MLSHLVSVHMTLQTLNVAVNCNLPSNGVMNSVLCFSILFAGEIQKKGIVTPLTRDIYPSYSLCRRDPEEGDSDASDQRHLPSNPDEAKKRGHQKCRESQNTRLENSN